MSGPSARIAALQQDGHLTEAAVVVLHAVSGVPLHLLRAVRVRPASTNWLHAPWYPYRRGGAITVGRTIWYTRIWFSPDGYGDGSPGSTLQWMLHLAHEVGHLPQAERFGRTAWGKLRYVAAFTGQYMGRALLFRRPVHDGSPLEREADVGRQVLQALVREDMGQHPLIAAVHERSPELAERWCSTRQPYLAGLVGDCREKSLA